MKQDKKILVVTVNAWNSKVGDNTFPLLLEGYPEEKIASLFIREDSPNSTVTNQYFRISERKVLQSVFHKCKQTGAIVTVGEDNEKNSRLEKSTYGNKNSLYYPKLFARELVWKLGKWNTEELNAFLDSFAPDIVIYEMSRYIHLNNIVMHILNKTGAKGIGCFWDDTFTYKQEKSLGYKALRYFQRRNLKRLAIKTTSFFAITPKTKREADQFFGINSVVLTKPILVNNHNKYEDVHAPIKMLYTGNLGIGRVDTVKLLIRELLKTDKFYLDIYTNTQLSPKDLDDLNSRVSCVHAAVQQKEVLELQKQSDILLFVESLAEDNKIARLSFSTKITDYYSAGRCILAIGNQDLAPIELMKEENSAIVACSIVELQKKIEEIDNDTIAIYANKASIEGKKNHSINTIRTTFYSIIFE